MGFKSNRGDLMVIDFFMFSWSEVLTSLRVLFVVMWWVSLVLLSIIFINSTVYAVSYGRVLLSILGRVKPRYYLHFIRHCYQFANFGATSRWQGGAYWNGLGDWAYYDKKKGEWVVKEPKA